MKSQYAEKSKTEVLDQFKESNKNTSSDATVAVPRAATRDKPAVNKHQIIVDLNQRLRDLQNELESSRLQQKKSVGLLNCLSVSFKNDILITLKEEDREMQRQELIHLKENVKKMKSALHSKQLLYDANKKEMALAMEKLKSEEQSRKSLQKVWLANPKPDIFILVSVSFLISVSPNLIGHVFVLLRIAGVVVLGMFYMEVSYVSLTSVN